MLLFLAALGAFTQSSAATKVYTFDYGVYGLGSAGSVVSALLRDLGHTVGGLDELAQNGGSTNTDNEGNDYGMIALINTTRANQTGYPFEFNMNHGGMVGWVKRFAGEDNIQAFGPFGFGSPFFTADLNANVGINFAGFSDPVDADDILWLANYLETTYSDLNFQPGYPRNISASLAMSFTDWINQDANLTRFKNMLTEACRSGGLDPSKTPALYVLKEQAIYLRAAREGGWLFKVASGNQDYYDGIREYVESDAQSKFFFNAEVTHIILSNGGNGPVAVKFNYNGEKHIMHVGKLVWAIAPTPENFEIVTHLPTEISNAFADMTVHPGFYTTKNRVLENIYGFPVVSMETLSNTDNFKYPTGNGVVEVYTRTAELFAGLVQTTEPMEIEEVSLIVANNFTQLANLPHGMTLQMEQIWHHKGYMAGFSIEKLQADPGIYGTIEDVLCLGGLVIIGRAIGYDDSTQIAEKTNQTLSRCLNLGTRRRSQTVPTTDDTTSDEKNNKQRWRRVMTADMHAKIAAKNQRREAMLQRFAAEHNATAAYEHYNRTRASNQGWHSSSFPGESHQDVKFKLWARFAHK
jgi:hypothetical protein